ncbi:MAG: class I SAM-dependent methyltransferase [Candidatus Hodarchaeales archaeon]|jgi:SAM-dependent methyltransferase
MTWNSWLTENKFTLFRSSIIQEQFIQCIIDHTRKGDLILEAGFGFGTTTELLRDLDYEIYGFDLEKIAVEKTSERYPLLKDRLYVGNILSEDSYTRFYDTIIHQGVLEHFQDDDIISILKLQSRKCKQIIFDVPNSNRENTEDEGDGTRFETPQFWESIISKSDLEFKRFGRNYDYGNDFLSKNLSRYDSDLMKKIGRSSIFVVKGELK